MNDDGVSLNTIAHPTRHGHSVLCSVWDGGSCDCGKADNLRVLKPTKLIVRGDDMAEALKVMKTIFDEH